LKQSKGFTNLDTKIQNLVQALVQNQTLFKELITEQTAALTTAIEATGSVIITHVERNRDQIDLLVQSSVTNKYDLTPAKACEMLYFDTMDDRYAHIDEAYKSTFEWIYKHSDQPHSSGPNNFIKWLEIGKGVYWVEGKAGSGKSTLMKFIYQDSRTREALECWANGQSLIIASVFFWSPGSPLQKSQIGLLRSLIYESLYNKRHLWPVVFS
jgi:hypothetical protein